MNKGYYKKYLLLSLIMFGLAIWNFLCLRSFFDKDEGNHLLALYNQSAESRAELHKYPDLYNKVEHALIHFVVFPINTILGIIFLVIAINSYRNGRRFCPYCKKKIHTEAKLCPYCRSNLDVAIAKDSKVVN